MIYPFHCLPIATYHKSLSEIKVVWSTTNHRLPFAETMKLSPKPLVSTTTETVPARKVGSETQISCGWVRMRENGRESDVDINGNRRRIAIITGGNG